MITRDESPEGPLLAEAERQSGLEDWGDHQSFHVGLRVLLASLAESGLPDDAQETFRNGWIQRLIQRLQLIDHRKKHPQIVAEQIDRPIAVIGLPRTGTTVLVDILALDPASRSPLQWEAELPWPPPARESWADDPRIAAVEARNAAIAEVNPEMAGMHTNGALLPAECNSFMAIDFWSPNFWAQQTFPRFEYWLAHSRIDQPYRTHHRILQHLQYHGPQGRWTLKSPFHQFDLPALVEEYPDIMLVHTHRDPVAITGSNAALVAAVRRLPAGHPERAVVGRSNLALWSEGIRRGMAARSDPALDAYVYDMSNRTLQQDPIGSVQALYDHFGLPFTDEYRARLQDWIARPSQPVPGKQYSLEEHGLDVAAIEREYADYRERFADYI